MGQRGSIGRVIRSGLSGSLARLVAARGRLAQVQVEYGRRGPHQRDRALGRGPERCGVAAGGRVGAEVNQFAGHAAGRRLPGVGVVVGQRNRTGPADGRGDAHPQGEVAGQPAVEGEPVGPHAEAGYRGELPGEPVHVGHVTGAACVAGSEPDELLFPLPHFARTGHAGGRTTAPGRTGAGSRQRSRRARADSAGGEEARAGRSRPREELPPRQAGAPWRAAVAGVAGIGRMAGFHVHFRSLLEAGRYRRGGTGDPGQRRGRRHAGCGEDQAWQWVEYAHHPARNAMFAVTQIARPHCALGAALTGADTAPVQFIAWAGREGERAESCMTQLPRTVRDKGLSFFSSGSPGVAPLRSGMTFSQATECSSCQSTKEAAAPVPGSAAISTRPAARLARVAHSPGGNGRLLAARAASPSAAGKGSATSGPPGTRPGTARDDRSPRARRPRYRK